MSFDSVKSQMEHNKTSQVATFSTGAKRGTDHLDCDLSLIPPEAIRAWGRAFAEGRAKYGRDNWLKGFPQMGIINHALQHIFSYLDGDTSEDHLGHAMWNIGVAIHQQKYRPDMLDLPPYRDSAVSEASCQTSPGPLELPSEFIPHDGGNDTKKNNGIDFRESLRHEEQVKAVYPNAALHHRPDEGCMIESNVYQTVFNWISDSCDTPEEAWKSAAERIASKHKKPESIFQPQINIPDGSY